MWKSLGSPHLPEDNLEMQWHREKHFAAAKVPVQAQRSRAEPWCDPEPPGAPSPGAAPGGTGEPCWGRAQGQALVLLHSRVT